MSWIRIKKANQVIKKEIHAMEMENQSGHHQRSNILIISAIFFGVFALIFYVVSFKVTGIQHNDLFYIALYFQVVVFSGVLYFYVKNIIVKALLSMICSNFVLMMLIYGYNFIYGNEQFTNFTLSLSIGLIISLLTILWNFLKSPTR